MRAAVFIALVACGHHDDRAARRDARPIDAAIAVERVSIASMTTRDGWGLGVTVRVAVPPTVVTRCSELWSSRVVIDRKQPTGDGPTYYAYAFGAAHWEHAPAACDVEIHLPTQHAAAYEACWRGEHVTEGPCRELLEVDPVPDQLAIEDVRFDSERHALSWIEVVGKADTAKPAVIAHVACAADGKRFAAVAAQASLPAGSEPGDRVPFTRTMLEYTRMNFEACDITFDPPLHEECWRPGRSDPNMCENLPLPELVTGVPVVIGPRVQLSTDGGLAIDTELTLEELPLGPAMIDVSARYRLGSKNPWKTASTVVSIDDLNPGDSTVARAALPITGPKPQELEATFTWKSTTTRELAVYCFRFGTPRLGKCTD